jgi:hypothetical protein
MTNNQQFTARNRARCIQFEDDVMENLTPAASAAKAELPRKRGAQI